MGTQVSYSMMSFWLFLAWAGCVPLPAGLSRLSARTHVSYLLNTNLATIRWVIALGGLAGVQVQLQHLMDANACTEQSACGTAH